MDIRTIPHNPRRTAAVIAVAGLLPRRPHRRTDAFVDRRRATPGKGAMMQKLRVALVPLVVPLVLLLALIVGLLGWTGAGLAGAQTTTTYSKLGPYDCGQKKISILFFPSGHGAFTQDGFNYPAGPTPHLEVSTGRPYLVHFLALLGNKGGFFNHNRKVCARITTATGKVKAMRSVKKQTVNALLECSFKTNAIMAIVPTATSLTLTVVASNESVVTIAIRATGATARYNSKLCKSKPAVA